LKDARKQFLFSKRALKREGKRGKNEKWSSSALTELEKGA